MRKTLISREVEESRSPDFNWLNLLMIARVELTSEDPEHPIESALNPSEAGGWRALQPGRQTIRLLFDEPRQIKHVHLEFQEPDQQRTQEFVLRWSEDDGQPYREIVRQQYNFNPPDSGRETENYTVELVGATALELVIVPNISGGEACASLACLRLA